MFWLYLLKLVLIEANSLGFITFSNFGQNYKGIIQLYDSNNQTLSLNSVTIFIFTRPSTTSEGSGSRHSTKSGQVTFFLSLWCEGVYEIVAQSPGYTEALSPLVNITDDQCYPLTINITQISLDLFSVSIDLRFDYFGTLFTSCDFEIVEIQGESYNGVNYQSQAAGFTNFYISFNHNGKFKFVAIGNEYYSRYFEIDYNLTETNLLYLKSQFLVEAPTIVTKPFSILVEVFQDSTLTIKSLNDFYPISLITTPTSSFLFPQDFILTTNGEVIFTNLSLNLTGSCSIIAYSPNIISSFSPIFTLNSITIDFSFSPKKPLYREDIFSLTISLYIKTTLYTYDSYTIDLQVYPNTNLLGNSIGNTTNGVYTFNNLQMSSFNTFRFLGYVYGYASFSDYVIISPYAYVNISDLIIEPNVPFSFSLFFYEDPDLTILYTETRPKFTLRVQPGNTFICSNAIFGSSNKLCQSTTLKKPGFYTFQLDIKYNILNANNITIKGYSNTKYSPIVNIIQPINPNDNINAVVTVYQDKTLQISYDQMDFIINEIQIDYNENDVVTEKTFSGVAYMENLTVKGLGDIVLMYTSDFLFPSLSFLKLKAYLNIEPVGEYPSNAETQYSIIVSAYKNYEKTILYPLKSCNFYIELDPLGDMTEWNCNVNDEGKILISDFYIVSPGTYSFIVYNDEFYFDAFSYNFNVTSTKNVFGVTISQSFGVKIIGTDFDIKVLLTDRTGELIKNPVQVFLVSLNFELKEFKLIYTENGEAHFNLIMRYPGKYIITALTDNDSPLATYNNITVHIIDPLCVRSDENDICLKCIDNAVIVYQVCMCEENSYWNQSIKACVCKETYISYDGHCVPCKNFLNSEDALSFYSEDYSSIYINFSYPITSNDTMNCINIISLPPSLADYIIDCIWVTSQQILLKSNSQLPPLNSYIKILKPLTSENASCSLFDNNIEILIQNLYPLPLPIIKFQAPSTYSISCSKSNLVISSIKNPDYSYKWSLISDPKNPNLTNELSNETSYILIIPKNLLYNGTYNFTLTVLSAKYKTQAYQTLQILITNTINLEINFNTGPEVSIKPNDYLYIKAIVVNNCGIDEVPIFSWRIISSLGLDQSKELDYNGDTALIESKYLNTGQDYIVTVTARIGDYPDNTFYSILHVLEQDLVVRFNRESGTIGLDFDLEIGVYVEDPDNKESVIDLEWKCYEGNKHCLDKYGEKIIDKGKYPWVIVDKDKLRNGALYSFTCTASTSKKSKSITVDIKIESSIIGKLEIISPDNPIIEKSPILITCQLTNISISDLIWSSSANFPIVSSNYGTKSILKLLPEYLKPAEKCEISASIHNKNLTTYTYISRNPIPTCSSLISTKLNAKWSLTAKNCISQISNLKYQYGFIDNLEKTHWSTEEILLDTISLYGINNATNAVVKVCDSSGCNYYYTKLNSGRERSVDEGLSFEEDIKNTSSVPDLIVFYLKNFNQEDFKGIFKAFKEFFNKKNYDEARFYVFLDCLMAFRPYTYLLTSDQAKDFIKLIILALNEYNNEIESDLVEDIINIVYAVEDRITSEIILEVFEYLNIYNSLNILPGNKNYYYSDVILYNTRFTNTNILNIDESSFKFDSSSILNETIVYDFYFAKYIHQINNEIVLQASLYALGAYDDYSNFKIKNREKIYLGNIVILFKQERSEKFLSYSCASLDNKYWYNSKCILSVSDTDISISLSKTTSVSIQLHTISQCSSRNLISITLAITSFVTLLFSIIFLVYDKNSQNNLVIPRQIYSIASLLSSQMQSKRAFTIFYLNVLSTFLLAYLGIFLKIFKNKEKYIVYLSAGLSCFFILEILSVSLLYFKLKLFDKVYGKLALWISCLIFIGVCFFLALYMSDCSEEDKIWIIIWGIVFFIHSVFIEGIYGAAVNCYLNRKVQQRRTIDESVEIVVLDENYNKEGKKIDEVEEEEKTFDNK
ncbi:hypothetical protein SteCoe_26050 [Stentor coeruleus]|uniref:Ig-like domain-containing protein n=1 Tax=Stentor coeruleus TaxID=5963 RepID=A0A1R2BDS5_9CILI|nr:hypothetical protein SteCoe_26050 [Stentor coeruleus]